MPNPFRAFVGDSRDNHPFVIPHDNVPVPNERCPQLLHVLYVTPSRSTKTDREETGSRPIGAPAIPRWIEFIGALFDMNMSLTPVGTDQYFVHGMEKAGCDMGNGRQIESHEGFKVFSFPVQANEDQRNRAAVLTVHQHMSRPRRFHTPTHTVVFAVIDTERDWEVEVEFHFKMDFDSAEVTYANGTTVPLSDGDVQVESEMQRVSVDIERRFNVLNLTDFPSTVDTSFQLSPSWTDLKTLSEGAYEQWKGSLPAF